MEEGHVTTEVEIGVEMAINQGMLVASRSWEKKRMNSTHLPPLLVSPEGTKPVTSWFLLCKTKLRLLTLTTVRES